METELKGEARAREVIRRLARGAAVREVADDYGMAVSQVQLIKAGKSWAKLPRPESWPRQRNPRLTDQEAQEIIDRVAAGEDRHDVIFDYRFDMTDGCLSSLLTGRTFPHLRRPVVMPKVAPPAKRPRNERVGELAPSSKLTAIEVKALAYRFAAGEGGSIGQLKAMGREHEVHWQTIKAIRDGKTWTNVTGIVPKGRKI